MRRNEERQEGMGQGETKRDRERKGEKGRDLNRITKDMERRDKER